MIADVSWQRLELGIPGPDERPAAAGPDQRPGRGAEPTGSSGGLEEPGPFLRSADHLRASIRDAVAGHPPGPRALVPALVDGDDGAMPEDLKEDFRTSGLTHLLAVSGTNLTLVVGSLLLLARWAGVRARGLAVVGALGVVGFVLLARTEPSVVRAAAMGAVGLIGMGHHGRRRGTRALGAAVLLLLLFDPWLALTMGFALSVLATAGILWLAPGWRDRLMRWLPRWVAEAVSVPLAAQIACTPLVAAISGQVSLVAVGANLLAAPAVGPATVLGLAGGVVGLVAEPLGRLVAAPAAWCAGWIIAVAVRGADLPVAAFDWPAGPVGIAVPDADLHRAVPVPRRAAGQAGHHAGPGRGDGVCPAVPAADPGMAGEGLGDGRLRRGPGRRPGAQRRARGRPWWWTRVRTRRRWTGACAGSVWSGSRSSCSRTSTPTTSTGSRAC